MSDKLSDGVHPPFVNEYIRQPLLSEDEAAQKLADKLIAQVDADILAELTGVQPMHKDVRKALNVTISDWMLENDFDYRK